MDVADPRGAGATDQAGHLMTVPDHAHTGRAEENRKAKASALAAAAAALGLQPYELKITDGTAEHAENRARVRRAAGVPRDPSTETWQMAIAFLLARALTRPGVRTCRACAGPVLDVVTVNGTALVLDPNAHPAGTVLPVATPAGQRARVLVGGDDWPDDTPLYRQHAASCPASPRRAQRPAPKCRDCGEPLDAVLAFRDPTYTTHPSCNPERR